jgi:4-carboxymuconolactone decarboxylase
MVRAPPLGHVSDVTHSCVHRIAHEPIGRAAGLTDEQIAAIRDISYVRSSTPRPSPTLPPLLAAALAYADSMTVDVKVSQDTFDALRAHLKDQQIMEATATVASYNMVSRVLVALDVNDMADVEVPTVG